MTKIEKRKILDEFAEKFIQKDVSPTYQKIVNDNFWDLLVDKDKPLK